MYAHVPAITTVHLTAYVNRSLLCSPGRNVVIEQRDVLVETHVKEEWSERGVDDNQARAPPERGGAIRAVTHPSPPICNTHKHGLVHTEGVEQSGQSHIPPLRSTIHTRVSSHCRNPGSGTFLLSDLQHTQTRASSHCTGWSNLGIHTYHPCCLQNNGKFQN